MCLCSIQQCRSCAARGQEEGGFYNDQQRGHLKWYSSHREGSRGDCHTHSVFKEFQAEFIASNNYNHETLNKDTCGGCYQVFVEEDRQTWKVVYYTSYDAEYVSCGCVMFQMLILCQHALYILNKKKVMELPEYYRLSRWTLSVRIWLVID